MPKNFSSQEAAEAAARLKEITRLHQQNKNDLSYKEIFQKHNIPMIALSEYLGLCYSYTCNVIAGSRPMTPEIKAKLDSIVEGLEKSGKE